MFSHERITTQELHVLLIIAILAISLVAVTVMAAFPDFFQIPSSGQIVHGYLPPLHVEGRYILDEGGNHVYLRGVNNDAILIGDPDGGWYLAESNFAQMEAWGINAIRIHTNVEYFHFNTENYIQNMHNLLDIAAQHGVYVVYDVAGVTVNDWPCPSPVVPYHSTVGTWWTSEEDYYDFWVALVSEFDSHPNIIWDSHNEPTDETGMSLSEWVRICNEVVNRIRPITQKPFIFEWDYAGELNYLRDPSNRIQDNNIIYSAHVYRYWGHFGWIGTRQSSAMYDYDSIYEWVMTEPEGYWDHHFDWDYVLNTLNVPIWIGETGPAPQWDAPDDYPYPYSGDAYDYASEQNPNDQHESEGWRAFLHVLNDLELGYAQFQWWADTRNWGILADTEPFAPNEYCQILIDAIATG